MGLGCFGWRTPGSVERSFMVSRAEFLMGSLAAAAAAGAARVPALAADGRTALDRFIAIPTPEYHFQLASTSISGGRRTRTYWMISQQWRTARDVDKPLWKHWLTITEPEHTTTDVCLLVISGGSSTDAPPAHVSSIITDVASQTGAAVAELRAVPNQPLRFTDETFARSEDDIIAYTWNKFLRTGDETWPLHLPMTKAAVRAMDTVTAVLPHVRRFIVGGASKRGWTTWLTAASDSRVIAIVPVVIDTLNVESNAEHAYRVYGFWPPALEPYDKMRIMQWIGTSQFEALMQIQDPYSYRDRITVPKLIVNATGDQYFTPDSSQFYFSGLEGEKYLRYVPNTDHSLKGAARTAAETGKAFVDSIIGGTTRPQYDWQIQPDGTIAVQTTAKPAEARLWQAFNPNARDFRFQTIGAGFTSTDLHNNGALTYAAKLPQPSRGFAAYFIELTYLTPHNDRFTVTTGVHVTPDVLPHRLA